MGKAIFEKSTLLYANAWQRYGNIPHDNITHVEVDSVDVPDERTERWDGATGIRPATALELTAYDDAKKETTALALSDLKPVITSVLEILYENPDLLASYASVGAFKLAVKNRYKSKL